MHDRIGNYEIDAELGRGGFGRVFRAYHPSMGWPVAIKVLQAANPELLARFRAEAGLTRKLQHKNIVTIYDFGEQDGTPYIVMELLEGEDLQTILDEKRRLSLLEKLRIISQMAEGLHYAHTCGVIHRDVKPANIMVLPNGQVKVMDFGIARLIARSSSGSTKAGQIAGTTSYMAPEQFRGHDADVQTDVFALGVISYELLGGVHPFRDPGDENSAMYRIMSAEPLKLRELLPECSEPLESLVNRAIAKDRNQRFAGLDDLLLDLEPIIIDLRHEHAANLVANVSALVARGEFDAAQTELKQALELDPANREARRIRETLNEERNKKLLERNIAALEREAAMKLTARQFSEGVAKLESALLLKPGDPRLTTLLNDAKAKRSANREVGRLLSEAKREVQNEQHYEARKFVLKAIEIDAEHPDAKALLKHLDYAIERIESAKRLKEDLQNAESLLRGRQYDLAIQKLEAMEALLPGTPQIVEMHERVRARQMEDYRQERARALETGLREARKLQMAGALEEAIASCNTLSAEFPGVSSIENLKAIVQQELSAKSRGELLETLLKEARGIIWDRRLSEAVSFLETALEQFPADLALERLLTAARALITDGSRTEALATVLESARTFRNQSRFDEALEVLKEGIRVNGQETVLTDFLRVVSLDNEEQRSREKLSRYIRDSVMLLGAGSAAESLAILREARTQFPSHPSLEMVLATAEESFARQNEKEIVAAVRKAVLDREQADDLPGAQEEVSKGLRRLPASKDLIQIDMSLRERVLVVDREKRIEYLVREIENAIATGDWNRARANNALARNEFPEQIVFDSLATRISQSQKNAEVEKALSDARDLLNKGKLDEAGFELAHLEPEHGTHTLWKAEKGRLDELQGFVAELRKAEELRNRGQFENAREIVERLVASAGAGGTAFAAQAAALLKIIRSELDARPGSTTTTKIATQLGKLCPACGNRLPEQARFCDRCGKAMPKA